MDEKLGTRQARATFARVAETDLDHVQATSRDILLLLTAGGICLWVLFVPWTADRSQVGPEAWWGVLALSVAVAVAWRLRGRAKRTSSITLCVALFAAMVLLTIGTGMNAAPYGFAVVVFIAGTLLDDLVAVLLSLAAPVAIILLGKRCFGLGPLSAQVLGPVVVTAGAIAVSWLSTWNLRTALSWTSQSMLLAAHNLEQARQRSGELARALKSLDESAHRIDRLNYQLQVALEAAREAEQLKARFAANVSHELRTPLNLIVGFSSLLFERSELYGNELPARFLHDLGIIHRNALQLQRLVNDVLDLSQIQSAGMTISPEPVAPETLVRETADTVRHLVEAEGLALCVQVEPDLPEVMVDPTRIRQVLINLLTNAVRFTRKGRIWLEAERADDAVVFRVRDTGVGIAPRDIPELFREFHRLEEPSARHQGGSGLGLAISKAFVELHGGRIWVESKLGEGSTFSFTIPIDGHVANRGGALIEERAIAPPPSRSVIVALTQSEKGYRLLRRYLPGRQVIMAREAEQGNELLQQVQPQWIVVDRAVAGDLEARSGRAAPALKAGSVPLLICDLPQDARVVADANVAGYLVKPVANNELLQAVRQLGPEVDTVLVVGDDRDFVQLVSRLLQLPPRVCTVIKAFTAQEALQLATSRVPDLILLDLVLPDMSGEELLARMRERRTLARVPVIVITGQSDSGLVQEPATEGNLLVVTQQNGGSAGARVLEWIRAIVSYRPADDRP